MSRSGAAACHEPFARGKISSPPSWRAHSDQEAGFVALSDWLFARAAPRQAG
jgi:hypothetical protein